MALYYFSNGEFEEIKGSNFGIGGVMRKEKQFFPHKIEYKPGDLFYMFSDGFCDQFGELTDKKFKYWRFRQLIESVQGQSMSAQKKSLERSFSEWKGSTQQIDDVTVFGFQI